MSFNEETNSKSSKHNPVPFKNSKGQNACYINVILHSLFYFEEIRRSLIDLNISPNFKGSKLMQELQKILRKYNQSYSNKSNEITILDSKDFRTELARFHKSNKSNIKFQLNEQNDPIELLTFIINLNHSLVINPNELLESNDSECNPMCSSHSSFYIELLVKCSDNCKSNNILKYSNNYFIFEIYPLEILSLIKKSQLKQNEIKGQLFSLTKLAILSNTKQCNECHKDKLLLCVNTSEYLLINLVMERCDNKKADEINQGLLLLIAQTVSNTDLFEYVDYEEREKRYFLFGMLLYYKSHYLCVFNENGKWLMYDDNLYVVFNDWNELIEKLIKNIYMPISLYYKEELRKRRRAVVRQNDSNNSTTYQYDPVISNEVKSNDDSLTKPSTNSNETSMSKNSIVDPKSATEDETKKMIKPDNKVYDNSLNEKVKFNQYRIKPNESVKENKKESSKEKDGSSNDQVFVKTISYHKSAIFQAINEKKDITTANTKKKDEKKINNKEIISEQLPKKQVEHKAQDRSFKIIQPSSENKTNSNHFINENENSIKDKSLFSETNSISSSLAKMQKDTRTVFPSSYLLSSQNINKTKEIKMEKSIINDKEWKCKICEMINSIQTYLCKNCFRVELELYLKSQNNTSSNYLILQKTEEKNNFSVINNQLNNATPSLLTKNNVNTIQSSDRIKSQTQMHPRSFNKTDKDSNKELHQSNKEILNATPIPIQEDSVLSPHLTKTLKRKRAKKEKIMEDISPNSNSNYNNNQILINKPEEPKKKQCSICQGTSFYETKCTNCGTEYRDQIKSSTIHKYNNFNNHGFEF